MTNKHVICCSIESKFDSTRHAVFEYIKFGFM